MTIDQQGGRVEQLKTALASSNGYGPPKYRRFLATTTVLNFWQTSENNTVHSCTWYTARFSERP